MAWHNGTCYFCGQVTEVGKIECMQVESCKPCFIKGQNQQRQQELIKKAKFN